VAVMFNYTI